MTRQDYYPTSNAAQILWLENFRNKIKNHADILSLSPEETTAIIADARWLVYLLGSWLPAERQWHKSVSQSVELLQSGTSMTMASLPTFTPPAAPVAMDGQPAVVPVNEGALTRIFNVVKRIKLASTYNESIGVDLGLRGGAAQGPDVTTLSPVLRASIVSGQVLINWNWGGFGEWLDACELQVDLADGKGFQLLAFDTTPNYVDTRPFPESLTKWTYRGIYHVDGARIGQWSAPVSVAVDGS